MYTHRIKDTQKAMEISTSWTINVHRVVFRIPGSHNTEKVGGKENRI
jgi:hypothetical protein